MTQNLKARISGHQPRLPLVDIDAEGEGAARSAPSPDPDADWRLDEHTRMVGRMGIAAARARLHSSSSRRTGPGRGTDASTSRRTPDRAA